MKDKKDDLPAMPFYFGDWTKAPEIRALELGDRMIWFEMLGFMWESTERGYLTINNKPIPEDTLARMLGLTVDRLRVGLVAMKDLNVFSVREDGAIYSRRMVGDNAKREKFREFGKKGGNPKLIRLRVGLSQGLSSPVNENENENEDIIIKEVVKKWNDFAELNGLAKLVKLTDKRTKKLQKRLTDENFNIDHILTRISESDFLLGKTKDWKVDFDFIIENETNFTKILEGKYSGKTNNGSGTSNDELARIATQRAIRNKG